MKITPTTRFCPMGFLFGLILALSSWGHAKSEAKTVLVDEGTPVVTVVINEDAPELTQQAAAKLIHYLKEISGAELSVVHSSDAVKTPGILWIGAHKELQKRYPSAELSVKESEETLIKTLGKDLVILGQDIVAPDGVQLEAGTNLAVSSFIEEQLGVRWLWPGKYGTVIPKSATITISPLEIRYAPQLHYRNTNWTTFYRGYKSLSKEGKARLATYHEDPLRWSREKDRLAREWINHHRGDSRATGQELTSLAGSLWTYRNRHAYGRWFRDYGKDHPEWFAQQPDGSRAPYPSERDVKMCISNPEVGEQWLKNAKRYFEENPHATTFETSENDHGWEGYCLCENCLAWDNKEAEILESKIRWQDESRTFYALTDRYAKFWNKMAQRLKEEFPDRDVNVSTYAYHVTRPAPTIKLEENVIPTFIGIERRDYIRNNEEHTLDQRRIWKGWWEAVGRRDAIVWRPNLMIRAIGLPYIFTERYAENMHFMADHGMLGIVFDGGVGKHWSVVGPQLYLMAKMAWTPKANAKEILQDYYQHGFGPAAPYIEQYYQQFEDLYASLIAKGYEKYGYSIYTDPPRLFREIRQDDQPATGRLGQEGVTKHHVVEERAAVLLEKAAKAVENSDPEYQERVQFVNLGFEFIQAHLDTIEAVNEYRGSRTKENQQRALEAAERREAALKAQAGTFAVNEIQILANIEERASTLAPPKQK